MALSRRLGHQYRGSSELFTKGAYKKIAPKSDGTTSYIRFSYGQF